MILRPALDREIDAVYRIIEQGRARLAALGIDQWQGSRPDLALIRSDIAAGYCHVAVLGERFAGTIALIDDGEPNYDHLIEGSWLTGSLSADPSYICVHRLAVADDALGRGVAKGMLSFAELTAREAGRESVRIDTHPGNGPMRTLLADCGYQKCGVILLDEALGELTRERLVYEKILED